MRRFLILAGAFLLVATASFGYDILLAYADYDSYAAGFQSALGAEDDMDVTGMGGLQGMTPSLSQIENYDGVATWSNYPYSNPSGWGDVLAEYVDGGGKVIIMTFAYGGVGGCGVQGGIASSPYSPIVPQDFAYGSGFWYLDLDDPDEPDNPIIEGVDSVGNNFHNNGRPLTDCGNSVVTWTNGNNGVAYNDNVNVVGVTGYPGNYSSWVSGDFALMIRNAFVWMIEYAAVPGAFALLTPADGEVIEVFTRGEDTPAFTAKGVATAGGNAMGVVTIHNRTSEPVDVDVEFTWEESEDVEDYSIMVDDDDDFSSPDVDETGITEETYTETFTLTESITYYWRVAAFNEAGETPCDADFMFEFDYNNTNVVPASLGHVKATFR